MITLKKLYGFRENRQFLKREPIIPALNPRIRWVQTDVTQTIMHALSISQCFCIKDLIVDKKYLSGPSFFITVSLAVLSYQAVLNASRMQPKHYFFCKNIVEFVNGIKIKNKC